MEAAAYVRVSSQAQDHKSQRTELERVAKARRDTIARWYAEKMSGASTARPALEQLRQDARAGKVRRVYVYRLDRLTRSGQRQGVGSGTRDVDRQGRTRLRLPARSSLCM